MRVLQLAPPHGVLGPELTYGPIPRVAANYAVELQNHGYDTALCAMEGSRVEGVEVIEAPCQTTNDYDAQLRAVLPRIQDGEFDIVQTHAAELLIGLLKAGVHEQGVKLVATLHSQADRSGPRYQPFIDPAKGVHAVALSWFQGESLQRYFDIAGVVLNGVDTETYRPAEPVVKEDFALTLCRVAPDKGVAEAIETARRAGMRLLIAGGVQPWDEAFFEAEIAPKLAAGEVEYLGPLSDEQKLPYLQRALAVLQLTQCDEVCSLTALEAMAAGTPVVVSERGCFPEMVVEGVTGFVSNDIDVCSAGLRLAHTLDPQRIRGLTISRYSWENTGNMLAAAYENVLG